LKAYTAHGATDLAGASIGGLNLGRLRARLDLADGVLELADLRGRLADRADARGGPPATGLPSASRPVPPRGFPGRVRAQVASDREIRVDFEGARLPLGELIAAASTRVLPLSGCLTIRASAAARGNALADPGAWRLSGRAEVPEVSYRESVFRDVRT